MLAIGWLGREGTEWKMVLLDQNRRQLLVHTLLIQSGIFWGERPWKKQLSFIKLSVSRTAGDWGIPLLWNLRFIFWIFKRASIITLVVVKPLAEFLDQSSPVCIKYSCIYLWPNSLCLSPWCIGPHRQHWHVWNISHHEGVFYLHYLLFISFIGKTTCCQLNYFWYTWATVQKEGQLFNRLWLSCLF